MRRFLLILSLGAMFTAGLHAQPLPASGTTGLHVVYASAPDGTTQLFAQGLDPASGPWLAAFGATLPAPPSRWLHRRRTLGALEPAIEWVASARVGLMPLGSRVGNGALHLVDARTAPIASVIASTGNPAAYDLAVDAARQIAFVAEDDGVGTTVRGFRFDVPGQLTALNPPLLTLPGRPAAHVTGMLLEGAPGRLHVATERGISVIALRQGATDWEIQATLTTVPDVPMTNPALFDRAGVATVVIGTSRFDASRLPIQGGLFAWRADGSASEAQQFGLLPGLFPPRNFVPAAGTTELAVVGDGQRTYAYFLLRDPSPTAFFIRPSGVGVGRFLASAPMALSVIPYPEEGGEPFAIPTVNGTRIAIESSQGPPFTSVPPDGGEPIAILYTPLDPVGAASTEGLLAVPAPLGGRISTKGMDRPLWSRDGLRVIAATSHFPGAPNPGFPGLEVLNVPALFPVNFFTPPHYVVPNFTSPYRSIIFPSTFEPRDPTAVRGFDGLSFAGNVFNDGMASMMLTPFGEVGQFQQRAVPFIQSPAIPNFPAIHAPSFEDATLSTRAVPAAFGARRTVWNAYPPLGFIGLTMTAAIDDVMYVQPSGLNFYVQLGVLSGPDAPPIELRLPTGWITTSEILAL